MPYRGKPSKGCAECRRKRRKCDQGLPQCKQCIRRAIPCPGYRDVIDLMFCDQSESTIRKSQTKVDAKSDSPASEVEDVVDVLPINAVQVYVSRKSSVSRRTSYPNYLDVPRFANNVADPFRACVAAATIPIAQRIIHYFSSNFEGACVPIRPHGSPGAFLEHILQHELLFYTYMDGLSARYAILQSEPAEAQNSNTISIYYRQQTLRLLNEKLSSPSNAVDDASVSAVLTLARQAIADGNVRACHIHTKGLYRMVSLVGGLQGLSANLRETLWWHGFCYAAAFNVAPRWEHPPQLTPDSSTIPNMCFLQPHTPIFALGTGFEILGRVSKVFESFRPFTVEVCILTMVENLGHSGPYRLTMLQRCDDQEALLDDLKAKGAKISSPPEAAMFEAVRLALYLFSILDLRREDKVPEAMLYELKASLIVARPNKALSGLEKLYLWILFLAAKSNPDGELGDWFLEQFDETMEDLGIFDVAMLQSCLNTFMWVFWKNSPELDAILERIAFKKSKLKEPDELELGGNSPTEQIFSRSTSEMSPITYSASSSLSPELVLPEKRKPGDFSAFQGEISSPEKFELDLDLDIDSFDTEIDKEGDVVHSVEVVLL